MKRILRFILIIINILVVIALMFSGFGGHVSTSITTIPGIALMLFPAVFASTVLILIIDLLAWRRLAFLPALAMLICAAPFWNFCPLNISTPKVPRGGTEFTLLTYNVFNLKDLSPTDEGTNNSIANIVNEDADIVCLQESPSGLPTTWTGINEAQKNEIADMYPYCISVANGQNILSKYPLKKIDIKQTFDKSAFLLCVEADIKGIPVTLYNIHLQSLGLDDNDRELYGSLTRKPTTHKLEDARYGIMAKLSSAMQRRGIQAHILREYIDSIGSHNVIVTGDFNDIEDCYAQRVIEGKTLRSCFTSVGFGPTVTYNANRFYFNIDHILYGGNIKAIDYKLIKSRSSDHYPVLGTFATVP